MLAVRFQRIFQMCTYSLRSWFKLEKTPKGNVFNLLLCKNLWKTNDVDMKQFGSCVRPRFKNKSTPVPSIFSRSITAQRCQCKYPISVILHKSVQQHTILQTIVLHVVKTKVNQANWEKCYWAATNTKVCIKWTGANTHRKQNAKYVYAAWEAKLAHKGSQRHFCLFLAKWDFIFRRKFVDFPNKKRKNKQKTKALVCKCFSTDNQRKNHFFGQHKKSQERKQTKKARPEIRIPVCNVCILTIALMLLNYWKCLDAIPLFYWSVHIWNIQVHTLHPNMLIVHSIPEQKLVLATSSQWKPHLRNVRKISKLQPLVSTSPMKTQRAKAIFLQHLLYSHFLQSCSSGLGAGPVTQICSELSCLFTWSACLVILSGLSVQVTDL